MSSGNMSTVTKLQQLYKTNVTRGHVPGHVSPGVWIQARIFTKDDRSRRYKAKEAHVQIDVTSGGRFKRNSLIFMEINCKIINKFV